MATTKTAKTTVAKKPATKKALFKKKKLTKKITISYALGQLGWALLAAIVTAQLSSIWTGFDDTAAGIHWKGFMPVAVFSAIFMVSKIFDAISDPIIGYFSDKTRSKWGRRVPFMAISTLPFAIISVMVFIGFSQTMTATAVVLNSIMLMVMIIAFYVALTAYTIPYTALISDLSATSKERVQLSTSIAITYFIGSMLAYGAPTVWTIFYNGGMSLRIAILLTIAIFAGIAIIFLLVPVFMIKEKDYVDFKNLSQTNEKISFFKVIKEVFSYKKFRWFILADFLYWSGLIIFQSQVNYIVTGLLGIPLTNSIFFVGVMGIVSFLLYGPVATVMNKVGVRKGLIQFSFILFFVLFVYGSVMVLNRDQINQPIAWVEGMIFVAIAGVPMAILGVIENVVVSDVIAYAKAKDGVDKAAAFYSVRNLTMKFGQALGMGLGTMFLIFGKSQDSPLGIRLMLAFAALASLLGFLGMFFYEEQRFRGTKFLHKVTALKTKRDKLVKDADGRESTKHFAKKKEKIEKKFASLKKQQDKRFAKATTDEEHKEIKEFRANLSKWKKEELENNLNNSFAIKDIDNKIEELSTINDKEIKKFSKLKIESMKNKISKLESKNNAFNKKFAKKITISKKQQDKAFASAKGEELKEVKVYKENLSKWEKQKSQKTKDSFENKKGFYNSEIKLYKEMVNMYSLKR